MIAQRGNECISLSVLYVESVEVGRSSTMDTKWLGKIQDVNSENIWYAICIKYNKKMQLKTLLM